MSSKGAPALVCVPDVCADEDEDILPAKERASSYVHKLLSWRPQCLFGTTPESDDEEERERQRIMEELDNLPLPCDGGKYFMFHSIWSEVCIGKHTIFNGN